MTAYERVTAALNHEEVDFPPVSAFVENHAVYDHFAPGEPDLLRAAALVHRALGVDVTYAVSRPPRVEDEGREIHGGRAHVSGQTVWWKKPFRTMADLEAWRPSQPNPEAAVDAAWARYAAERAALEPDTVVMRQGGGFLLYYDTGLELVSYALHDRPALIEAMIENRYELVRAFTARFCARRPGPAFQICEDLACKHGLLFNPAFLRRVYFPRLRELVELIHGHGMKVIQHTDGDVSEVLEDLVDSGIDALNPLESMNLAAVKRRYGSRLVLIGNVDSRILAFGTPPEVRQAVAQNMRDGWGHGGHWLDTSAGEFMPDVPLSNALAYFDAAKDPALRP